MVKTINPSRNLLFKLITWCALYAFIGQTLCCSVWAFSPLTPQPLSHAEKKISIWRTIADFIITPAQAESDSVKYTLTPESNEDDVSGKSIKPEKEDPGGEIGTSSTGGGGVGGTISGGSGSVNSSMGAYVYSYPIQVPPGRGGLAPQLALDYNSLARNGWLGHGWNLYIGYIERSTKDGKPSYTDQDTFVINLKGSSITLIKEGDEFRLKDEGLFLRVRKLDDRWEATDKGGLTYSFGSEPNSKQVAPEGIFKWCLNSIKDRNGNTIHFTYDTDVANNQIYLKQISYDVDNIILFESELDRVDALTSYETHFKVNTTRRLKRIKVYTGSTSGTDPIRSFELMYHQDAHSKISKLESIQQVGTDGTPLPPVRFDYTSSKSPFGFLNLGETDLTIDNAGAKGFHMADFNGDGRTDYLETPSEGNSDIWKLYGSVGQNFALLSSGNGITKSHKIITGDYDGDGKADFLTYGNNGEGQVQLYLSTGTSFKKVGSVFPKESKRMYTGDFNGDGKTDILTRYSTDGYIGEGGPEGIEHGWKLYLANDQQGFDLAHSWIDMKNLSMFTSPDKQQIILGDYNGDGKTDVIMKPDFLKRTGSGSAVWGMYLSTGDRLEVVKKGEQGNAQIPHRYDNVYPGDYNGDGKTDILVTASDRAKSNWAGYKLNLSTGTDFITIDTPSDLKPSVDRKIFPGDYNGDGLTDVIQSYHGKDGSVIFSLSRYLVTGSGFERHLETQINFNREQTRYFTGDFDGDGRLDSFLVDKEKNAAKVIYHQTEYMGSRSVKLTTNNLLGKITNPLGTTTEITYEPSTIWPKDIDGDGTYNPMPMVLPTVDTVTSYDNMGEKEGTSVHVSTNTFAYEGGRYDIADKEFRGYGKIWMRDSASHLISERFYHQQPRFQGKLRKSITSLIDGSGIPEIPVKNRKILKPMVMTENIWAAHSYKGFSGADEVIYRTFAHVRDNITTNYDESGEKLSTITTLYKYDNFGNMELENKWIQNNANQEQITRCTETEYNNDAANWVLGMPKIIRVGESADGLTPPRACGPALREITMSYETNRPWLLKSTTQKVDKEIDGGKATLLTDITTNFRYDTYGNRTWVSNPRDPEWGTTMDYSESDGMFPNLTTNALGHKIHRTFDPRFGTITSETVSPDTIHAQTTNLTYDEFGRLDTITNPDTSKKTFIYTLSPKNHSVKVVSTLLPPVITYYDNLDREIKTEIVTYSKNILTRTEYNSEGQVWRKSLPYFDGEEALFTTNTYDARGRIVNIINPDKTSRSIEYNRFAKHIKNEEGITKSILTDLLGKLVHVIEPTGGETKYRYDFFGNLEWIRGPLGNETSISYDQLNRKSEMTDPYMGHWEYGYDEANNLTWQKDNEERVTKIEYDALNRPLIKEYVTSGDTVKYKYDVPTTVGSKEEPSYNTGKLINVMTWKKGILFPQSSISYKYDNMGRLFWESIGVEGENYKILRKFDLAGRLDMLTYPDPAKTQIDYDYDIAGRLESVWKIRGKNKEKIASYDTYNSLGQVGRVHYGNDVYTNYAYKSGNSRLSMLLIGTKIPGRLGTFKSVHQSYTYDNLGNIKTIKGHGEQNKFTYEYNYDSLSRLTSAKTLSPSSSERSFDQTYTYDLAGNMTQKTGIGGFEIKDWEDSTGHIRPTAIKYGKDTTGVGNRKVIYNEDNKPIQVNYKGKKQTSLLYDGLGKRIKKSSDDNTTIYVGGIFEENPEKKERICHVYAAGRRILSLKTFGISTTKPFYIHGDHLGSTSLITDANGMPIEEIGYLPFGSTLFRNVHNDGTFSSVRKFTDQEFDEEYELYNYNARLYDPAMARFTTADTIVPNWTDPQSLNRYSYCRNNPLKYVDPSGHSYTWDDFMDTIDGLRDQYDPFRIYENGGILGVTMFYFDPINSSFSYSHEGGWGTSGGGNYYIFTFGGRWQEKGEKAGYGGYLGVGWAFGKDGKVGLLLEGNSEGDYKVGLNASYKDYVGVGVYYQRDQGWGTSAYAGYNGISANYDFKTDGLSLGYKTDSGYGASYNFASDTASVSYSGKTYGGSLSYNFDTGNYSIGGTRSPYGGATYNSDGGTLTADLTKYPSEFNIHDTGHSVGGWAKKISDNPSYHYYDITIGGLYKSQWNYLLY